jgi:hypothetical protein
MQLFVNQSDFTGINLSTTGFTQGTWHLVVCSANGSSQVSMYVDGVLADSAPYDGTTNTDPEQTLSIRNYGNATGSIDIDEFGFSNGFITASQVSDMWNSGVGRFAECDPYSSSSSTSSDSQTSNSSDSQTSNSSDSVELLGFGHPDLDLYNDFITRLYKMDETGSTKRDIISGFALNELKSSPGIVGPTVGIDGNAANFDGSSALWMNSSVQIMSGPTILSLWVFPVALTGTQYLIHAVVPLDPSPGQSPGLYINNGGTVSYTLDDGGFTFTGTITSTDTLSAGSWNHIMIISDNTPNIPAYGPNEFFMYINGVEQASTMTPTSITSSSKTVVGARDSTYADPIQGDVDFFNGGIDEIINWYDQGSPSYVLRFGVSGLPTRQDFVDALYNSGTGRFMATSH